MVPFKTVALGTALALAMPVAAFACPDGSLSGAGLSYSSDAAYTPRAHGVIAGGSADLSRCPMPGTGYVAVAPDFELMFTGNGMGRALEFRAEAGCDTVLLVNDANGNWHFNDDDGSSTNSRIRINRASEGLYDIWVGTFGPSTCQANLIVETF